MRSLCGFDSRSSDLASLAQWKRSCFVISRLSVRCQLADIEPTGKLSNSQICPCRLKERLGGYEPSDARSSRGGDTVAVAERLCSGLWCRLMRVQSLRSTSVGAERVPKGTQHPVRVIRWPLRSSVIISGGSSTGELLIKTNPARDFNSNFKNCYPKAEVIGSNPIHRAVGHIQQFQPMAP